MKTVLPREQAVEDIFSKILASPEASRRLREVFYQYLDDEHMLVDEDPDHFLQVLFHAYQNGDVSALLLELCGKSIKVLSYIPDSDKPVRQKEVADMLSMISYAEENGEKKGENRLGTLMNILLKNKRYSDAEKASEDEEYREELYKEYKL